MKCFKLRKQIISLKKSIRDLITFVLLLSCAVGSVPSNQIYSALINDITSPCTELWRRMFVWQDGIVNPCDYDYKSLLSQWNAKTDTIKSIWNSEYYNELRDLHKAKERNKIEPCKRCINI